MGHYLLLTLVCSSQGLQVKWVRAGQTPLPAGSEEAQYREAVQQVGDRMAPGLPSCPLSILVSPAQLVQAGRQAASGEPVPVSSEHLWQGRH